MAVKSTAIPFLAGYLLSMASSSEELQKIKETSKSWFKR